MRFGLRLGRTVSAATVLSAAALVGAVTPGVAGAQALARPAATASADQMSGLIAAPWPARQRPSGRFAEYVPPLPGHAREQDRYGTAMLGYGLLQVGLRHRHRREVSAALRALGQAARHPLQGGTREVFDDLALASAYNLAAARLGRDPRFRAVARPWRERLRHVSVQVLNQPRSFYNFQLIEAIEILELLRTGLHSKDRGSVLARRTRSRRLVLELVSRRLPAVAGSESTPGPGGTMSLLGDPPFEPLAYHAFSLGLAARIISLMRARAPGPLRASLAQGALASAALVGPDGDLAYAGRSQEQAWALAMTAYGERVAAGLKGTAPAVAAQDRTLANQALSRLARLHLGGPYGLALTPALRLDPGQQRDALDVYVAGVSYTGLTLVGLQWTARVRQRGARRGARTGAGVWLLGQGPGQMAVVRSARQWHAVRLAPAEPTATSSYAGDLRYDAGLVALKRRDGSGEWRDVIPLRPRTSGAWDSVGPLLSAGGRVGRPTGHQLVLAPDGTIQLNGEFVDRSMGLLRTGELMRIVAVDCGVQVLIPALTGDVFEYSVFFREAPTVAGAPAATTSIQDSSEAISTSLPAAVTLTSGYGSGADPKLIRARLRFAPSSAQTIAVTVCGR